MSDRDSLENPFDENQISDDQLPSVDLNTGFDLTEEPEESKVHNLIDTPFTELMKDSEITQSASNLNSAREKKPSQETKKEGNSKKESKKNKSQAKKRVEKRYCTPLREKITAEDMNIDDSSEDEGMPDYKIGGYHAVHVGEVMMNRYVVVQKLGWGHFSTVWLTKDMKYDTFVALKIQKSASHYIEAAYDEVGILEQVSSFWKKQTWIDAIIKYYGGDPQLEKYLREKFVPLGEHSYVVQLLDAFMYSGPNGQHYVMVFEILGVNLLEIIKRYEYKGVPLHLARIIGKQCLMGLDYLH